MVRVTVLVTGAAGFIGSHVCEALVERHHDVVALDALTYAGNLENLKGSRCEWVCHDLSAPLPNLGVDVIVHCGAESHVDNATKNPQLCVRSNLLGTLNVLELARRQPVARFIYVSTDEVFGADKGAPFGPTDRLRPTNVYSATKAGAEHLVNSYCRSFGVPTMITRSCNVFGARQHAEKFIPQVVSRIVQGKIVDVHTTADGKMGRRRWCHVSEVARGLAFIADNGIAGDVYHLSEGVEKTNLEMVQAIADVIGYPWQQQIVPSSRKSYDESYSLEESRYASCWKGHESFETQLRQTVEWYLDNLGRL